MTYAQTTTQNVCRRRYFTLLYLNVENQGDGRENPKVKNLCRTFKFYSLLDAKNFFLILDFQYHYKRGEMYGFDS